MTRFARFEAIAAPLPLANVDTDKIIPARFLTTVSREGLGQGLFQTLRSDPEFVLNRMPWNEAAILVALDNFGCGSSREHAPWALRDFGIRCIIAPSFAEIFYNNCFKNGILPIRLKPDEVKTLLLLSSNPSSAAMKVDLARQTVETSDGGFFHFAIDTARKSALSVGCDDIARSLERLVEIEAFESDRRLPESWLPGIRLLEELSRI